VRARLWLLLPLLPLLLLLLQVLLQERQPAHCHPAVPHAAAAQPWLLVALWWHQTPQLPPWPEVQRWSPERVRPPPSPPSPLE
jgi:hypothetical protein